MVIKGNSRGGAAELAQHLQRADTNERVQLIELRGVAAPDLDGALREMEAVASGTRTKRCLYHASINTPVEERMTPEQRMMAVDRLEKELGLAGQARAVVVHEKKGREHCHVVWSRIDLVNMIAIPDSHNYRRHELVARDLERQFGHERVQGVHVERDGVERPQRTPNLAEMSQTARGGLSPEQARPKLTELWQATDSGQAFAAAIEKEGLILARGDRRDFVIIDPAGEPHSLARRIDGVRAKDVRERLADIDAASLPSVAEAKDIRAGRMRTAPEQVRQERIPEAVETAPKPAPTPEKAMPPPERQFTAAARTVPTPKAEKQRHAPSPNAVARRSSPEPDLTTAKIAKPVDRTAGFAARAIGKVFSLIAGLFESILAPPSPAQQRQAAREEAADRTAAFRRFVAEQSKTAFVLDDQRRRRQREERELEERRQEERDRRSREDRQR